MVDFTLNRRSALNGLLAISAAGALAACGNKDGQQTDTKTLSDTEFASIKGFFSVEEMVLISSMADSIIPTTETAGAVKAGVPQTIQSLASEWADGNYRSYWRNGLSAIDEALPNFTTLDAETRETVLGDYDTKVFEGQIENKFYRDMKSTIATAYYMSEVGATEELAYEPVPGDFKGCVPLAEYPKAWAT